MPSTPEVVGRDVELSALDALLTAVLAGEGRGVLLAGEAGVGKTTLASAFARRAEARGARVVTTRAPDESGAPAFFVWTEAFAAAGITFDRPTTLATDEARFAAVESVVAAVRKLAERGALVLVLDDIQWADAASLLALRRWARSTERGRVLVVATLRTPLTERTPESDLVEDFRREASEMRLAGLPPSALATMAEGAHLDAPAVGRLHALTQGNPLFAAELLADAEARAALRHGDAVDVPLPETVLATLARHLGRVDDASRRVLAWAALGPDVVDEALVADVAQVPLADVTSALSRAAERGVLVGASSARRFAHALFRAVAADLDDGMPRRERHRAWSRALASRGPEHLATAAHHAFAAGDDAGGAALAARAATRARRELAFEAAAALFARAADAHERMGHTTELAAALTDLAESLFDAGIVAQATATAERALAAARATGAPALVARAVLAIGRVRKLAVADRQLVPLLEEALAALPEHDTELRCAVEARLACALQPDLDPPRALGLARHAVARAREHGDLALRARTLHAARPAFRLLDDLDERIGMDRELLELAERLGDDVLAVNAHGRLLAQAFEAGSSEGAASHLAAYERLARRVRLAEHEIGARLAAIARHAMRGEIDEADRIVADLEASRSAWAPRLHVRAPLDPVLAGHVVVAAAADTPERHAAVFVRVKALRAPPPIGDLYNAFFGARAGELDVAGGAYRRVLAAVEPGRGLVLALQLADACIRLGDRETAPRLSAVLAPFADRHVLWAPLFVYDGSVARLLAGLARLSGNAAAADRFAADALRAEEHASASAFAARTRREHLGAAARPAASLPVPRFVHEGETWLVTYAGEATRLRDSDGLHYLARLVGRPDVPIAAVELLAARHAGGEPLAEADAGPVLDARALATYRARAAAMRERLADAERDGDLGAEGQARRELGFLEQEIARAVGLGGRPRRAASTSERARVTVTQRIRNAIRRIRVEAPRTADHLERAVRTGAACVYVAPLR